MTGDAHDRFRSRIGETIGVSPRQITLFAKGRVALYALLRALDVEPGDEVILPAFTCVAVPNAILYARARPVYVDIQPDTYTIDPAAVEDAVGPRTRIILAQNTFGLSADLAALDSIAARHGLTVVDDCTHGLGGRYRGLPNGSVAAASFFSTQWSKPVSTGLGGFAIARDAETAARLRNLEEAAPETGAVRSLLLRMLVGAAERAGNGRSFRAGRSAYRAMSRLGIVPASSGRTELEGSAMPDGFLTKLSAWQADLGSQRIGRLGPDVERRREIAGVYSRWLGEHGRTVPTEPAWATHSFLRYPIRVADRPTFSSAARRAGVDLGDWFVSPLHPITTGLDRWGFRSGGTPAAEAACAQVVNLPVDPTMTRPEVDRVVQFIASTVDLIT
jgi:dTDP-4-amino-4,6-dideoxygalactose transaminase